MRLIQFNSGLRVVLKDVQQEQAEPSPRYYLAPPPLQSTSVHYSSNSSIATTSSSIKSNTSIGTNHEFYSYRQYVPSTHSSIYSQCNQVKTPPAINTIPSSSVVVEVGISNKT